MERVETIVRYSLVATALSIYVGRHARPRGGRKTSGKACRRRLPSARDESRLDCGRSKQKVEQLEREGKHERSGE